MLAASGAEREAREFVQKSKVELKKKDIIIAQLMDKYNELKVRYEKPDKRKR